jgi:type II secretory pathway component GspD/PulD (secretin)
VLAGLLLATGLAWGLNWVWVSATPSEPDAAGEAAEEPKRGMAQKVSLDLRSTEATDALKYLATKGGLNIAISKNVTGRVNLYLTDVPLRDVFDLILRSNELAYDRQGDVYNVMTEAEYRALYGKKFSDLREVRTFRLQYAIPQQAFNLLDTLKSEVGRLLVDEDSGTVLVMDTAENLRRMDEALRVMEGSGLTTVLDLQYAKAEDIEESLGAQLETSKLGYIKADARTNQLVVKTLPERLAEIKSLVAALDRKTREVLIDSRIVKVTYDDDHTRGVNWDAVFTNLDFHGADDTASFRTTTSGTAPSEVPGVARISLDSILRKFTKKENATAGTELLLGTVSRDGYELLRYLDTVGETKLISNPRMLVTENQDAKIHVGTREAYVSTTTTTGQSTSTTAEAIEFIDVGIQLNVTPRINRDGYITMTVKPEVSSVVRTLETEQGTEVPIVDKSTVETTVMVADGSTVVLGGLRKDEKVMTRERLPGLAHIPLLGPTLFQQSTKNNVLTELVVFITPHIVQGDQLVTGDEAQAAVLGYRDYAPVLSERPSEGER